MLRRVIDATTAPVPLRPSPFACPVCGEQLGYNFVLRPGKDGTGYYLIGHDRLRVDPGFAFTMHIEQSDVKRWRGFDGALTIETVANWCRDLHRIVDDPAFARLVKAVIVDAYARPGGIHGEG